MKRFLKSVEGRVITALLIILAVVLLIGGLTSITQETKAGLLVFKSATVKALVNEYATYSDGDGIELKTVYLTLTALDPEKLLKSPEWYGFSVYKAKDSPRATEEIFFLSKRGDLRGCDKHRVRCVLHKYHEGLKYLEEVKCINSGQIAP